MVEGEGSWIYKVEVICAISYTLSSSIPCSLSNSFHPFTMHPSVLMAFMLPLSALAAPALVKRQIFKFPSSLTAIFLERPYRSVKLTPDLMNERTWIPADVAV